MSSVNKMQCPMHPNHIVSSKTLSMHEQLYSGAMSYITVKGQLCLQGTHQTYSQLFEHIILNTETQYGDISTCKADSMSTGSGVRPEEG